MSVSSSEPLLYQSGKTVLSIFNSTDLSKPKTIQTSKITLVVVLEGEITIDFKEYKQSYIVGESLIIPPHKAIRLESLKSNSQKKQTIENKISWLELQIPIETVNQTISYYNQMGILDNNCKLRVENNSVWQFGENPINVTNDTNIKKAIERLTDLFTEEHYNRDVFIDFAVKELILRFIQTPARDKIEVEQNDEVEDETNPSIEAVLEYIKEHIDEPISIDTLTDIASMSKAAFFRTFKESLDISPIDYINRERIEVAKNRLVDISKSVTDICYELGYNHMTYFIRVFKKYEGITPKQFQIKQNKENKEIIKNKQADKENKAKEEE